MFVKWDKNSCVYEIRCEALKMFKAVIAKGRKRGFLDNKYLIQVVNLMIQIKDRNDAITATASALGESFLVKAKEVNGKVVLSDDVSDEEIIAIIPLLVFELVEIMRRNKKDDFEQSKFLFAWIKDSI